MARKGRFITLEGGEGTGKSTLAAALNAVLGARGFDVVSTREPGGTPGAEALRGLLLAPPEGVAWSSISEALLFSAARSDHLDRLIRPSLEAGKLVICDRFADSTRAYQTALDSDMASVVDALERLCVGTWGPDLTLILDLPVDVATQRLAARGAGTDAIEARGRDYHERVRQAFLTIARREPWRCVVLDASVSPDELCGRAIDEIDRRLGSGDVE